MKYDVAIIGGGPAGYTAAEKAAAGGLSTVLFEKNALGGVCLNEGCVPTKTLLYSAKVFDTIKHAPKYAVSAENPAFDFPKIIARKNKVVKKLTAGIRMKMKENGVEVVSGEAEIKGRAADGTITIASGEAVYEAANLLICTGSETVIPPIPGLAETEYWTSREALLSKELPTSLVIIGGGVIGMEFASFFNSMGTEVHVVEMLDKILGPMDRELSEMLQVEYAKRGVKFYLGHKVTAVNGGDVTVDNVIPKHLDCITAKLREMGARVTEFDDSIRVEADRRLRRSNVKTMPYPGFPTDMQPQIAVCMALAEGTSLVTEGIYDNRFRYTAELNRMGASIQVESKTAVIDGVTQLHGCEVRACDLRAGAAMVIAALCAEGTTTIEDAHYIERGYEDIIGKFAAIGGKIRRIETFEGNSQDAAG